MVGSLCPGPAAAVVSAFQFLCVVLSQASEPGFNRQINK